MSTSSDRSAALLDARASGEIRSLEEVAESRPDSDDHATARMLHQSRTYIQDFAAAYETAEDAEGLIAKMTAKHPHHGNLWTLQFSSQAAVRRRDRARSAQIG